MNILPSAPTIRAVHQPSVPALFAGRFQVTTPCA